VKFGLIIILTLNILIGCRSTQSSVQSVNNQATSTQEAGFPTEICQQLEGAWATYRIRPNDDPRCRPQNQGCGYAGPLHLKCEGGKVTGYKLLMYASMPPPGKAITAPVEASWADEKIVVKYTDSQRCLNIYKVALNNEVLTGTFSRENCGSKDESGEFYGERFERRGMPNNSFNRSAN
jgi:hypothetical protein